MIKVISHDHNSYPEKLSDYFKVADDKKIKTNYTMVEDEMVANDLDPAFVK